MTDDVKHKPAMLECLDCGERWEGEWELKTLCPKCGRGFTFPIAHQRAVILKLVAGLKAAKRTLHNPGCVQRKKREGDTYCDCGLIKHNAAIDAVLSEIGESDAT